MCIKYFFLTILFCFSSAFPQMQPLRPYSRNNLLQTKISKSRFFSNLEEHKINLDNKKSNFINLYSGIYIPTNGEDKIGPAFGLGLQFGISQITSLCIDFNLGFSNDKKNDYTENITIIQIEAGPGFNFYKENKTNFFAAPKIGLSLMTETKKIETYGYPAVCISFEAGLHQEITNDLFLMLKIKENNMIGGVFYNCFFINGGISLKL